eukprot:CAMPEP_0202432654 /NCGR_PEP_ID=MMETSP1345-20130828/9991_1 /ASSEMBLY_ACC=CAM_ASM_000843 /TAXON_ID=342563 /ORGANISM="Fabrea Fabrea salina" /LENGTH=59 /DNA_ID=CAMNT_0049044753 /DNA_START=167 /DNA_END=346 /DNA_ORIENTATION=+
MNQFSTIAEGKVELTGIAKKGKNFMYFPYLASGPVIWEVIGLLCIETKELKASPRGSRK